MPEEVSQAEKQLDDELRLEQKRVAILQARLQQLQLEKQIREYK